jgi:group I intron endonuclease
VFIEYYGFQADPDNLPLPLRAGVYQLLNLVNGKSYIGISQDVARRIRQHSDAKQKKLGNAIRKYGLHQFLVNPIAYSIDDRTDWLPVLEAQLITEFDAVKNGYNAVLASNAVGPYGEEFAQIVKDYYKAHPELAGIHFKKWWQTMSPEDRKEFVANREPARIAAFKKFYSDPERVAAQSKKRDTPEYREKKRIETVLRYSNPEERTRQSKRLKNYLSDPVAYNKRVEQLDTIKQLGSVAAAKAVSGSTWITDGTVNRRARSDQELPEGFYRGRTNFGNLGMKPRRSKT